MELFFSLQAYAGVVHYEFQTEFDNQATLYQLKHKINSKWKIADEDQNIFFEDGRQLVGRGANSLQSLGLQDGTKLIVKHALLSTWSAVLDRSSSFQQTDEKQLKKELREDAKRLIEDLVQARFFSTYPSFGTHRFAIEKTFLPHCDRESEQMRKLCRIHFKELYGKQVKVTFEYRKDGTVAGCVCVLDDRSTIRRFFVKTHHGARDRSSNTEYDIDLKELFVYKFLQELKIGADIDFIQGGMVSNYRVFIASKEIAGFKTLYFIQDTQPETVGEYIKCVNQMLFVYSVLMLADHHTANMGIDDGLNPFIVDFSIIGDLWVV